MKASKKSIMSSAHKKAFYFLSSLQTSLLWWLSSVQANLDWSKSTDT